ncbi:MAG: outer membrane protein assembly factor BamD [Acidobacteria bacterium]|nr:outer membrane protein assembly factor BamD [Acidobacteriota bacterium]
MKAVKIMILALAIALSFAACSGKAKNKITLEEAKGPGRDKELYRDAVDAIRKGAFDKGRILLNTMINTYPESPLVKIAKLSIADSFYLEGGSKNLAQAEVAYREFVEFFPDDPLADDVMIKMAEIHLRQVQSPDRDPTHAKLAERQLKETLRRYPNTDRKDLIEERMADVQEILAMHELKVARFNFELRQAMAGTQMRTEEILNKYPNFSRFDEALWLHAQTMAIQEDTETASRDLNRLLTNYPKSEYVDDAKKMLTKFGKAVPEPDPAKVTDAKSNAPGVMSKVTGLFLGTHIDTSNKGVIIDRELKTDEIVARAQELGGAAKADAPVTPGAETTSNAPDARPRRANGGASQDVEVKAGSATAAPSSTTKKDSNKKDKKDKKKNDNDGAAKVLRNP